MKTKFIATGVLISTVVISGCSSYRVSSNVQSPEVVAPTEVKQVMITEETLPEGTYSLIGPLEVSVKKLTVFHKDPTKEQANIELRKKAAGMGADAVMDVHYSSGIGLTTWGYMDAEGKAVKLQDKIEE